MLASRVTETLERVPSRSARIVPLSCRSCGRIWNKLKFYSLQNTDRPDILIFATLLYARLDHTRPQYVCSFLLMTDEANFHLKSKVNQQNCSEAFAIVQGNFEKN